MPSLLRSLFALRSAAVFALLLLVGLIALAGPPEALAQKKKVLTIAAKEPDTLDPHSSTLGQSQAITRFLYRGLTRFAIKDGKVTTAEVEPDLAESWTLSPDGTVWTFKLRKGVQFHKGFGEMTAEDVKFSFERQINRTPGTRYGVNLEVIKSIEVVDPHTIQIVLKAYDAIFLLRMVGYQQGYIVSKKAVEKHGEQFKWNPVGTGPFYFERHTPRERVVLRAFDRFPGGRPRSTRCTGSTCRRTPPSSSGSRRARSTCSIPKRSPPTSRTRSRRWARSSTGGARAGRSASTST